MPDEYAAFAPFYDLLSAEHPVYRAGRRAGAAALAPRPGDQVLDVGCGTGLNFALLQEAVGAPGRSSASTGVRGCSTGPGAGSAAGDGAT